MRSRGNGLVAPSNMPVSIMPGQMVVVQTELPRRLSSTRKASMKPMDACLDAQ